MLLIVNYGYQYWYSWRQADNELRAYKNRNLTYSSIPQVFTNTYVCTAVYSYVFGVYVYSIFFDFYKNSSTNNDIFFITVTKIFSAIIEGYSLVYTNS